MTYPQYPQPGATATPVRRNGMGTAGFILGLLAVLFAWIPFLGVIGWPLSILGIVFSVLGLARVRRHQADNRGLTIAGIVLSIIGLLVCILWVAGIASYSNQTTTGTVGALPAQPAVKEAPVSQTAAFGQTFTFTDGLAVTIDAPAPFRASQTSYPPPSQVERAVLFTVTVTNNTDRPYSVNTFGNGPRVTYAGQSAQEVTDIEKLPAAASPTVLPGKSFTYKKAFAVGKAPGELQAEWTREVIGGPVIFTGQG